VCVCVCVCVCVLEELKFMGFLVPIVGVTLRRGILHAISRDQNQSAVCERHMSQCPGDDVSFDVTATATVQCSSSSLTSSRSGSS